MSISEGGTLSPPGKTSIESVGVKISENPKNSWKFRSFENLWILCNGVFSMQLYMAYTPKDPLGIYGLYVGY
jgi:hypothetical protein